MIKRIRFNSRSTQAGGVNMDTLLIKDVLGNGGFLRVCIASTPAREHTPFIMADLHADRLPKTPVLTNFYFTLAIKSKPLFIPHEPEKDLEIIVTGRDAWAVDSHYDVLLGLYEEGQKEPLSVAEFEGVLLQDRRVFLDARIDSVTPPSLVLMLNFKLRDSLGVTV